MSLRLASIACLATASALSLAAGCSVINKLDPVVGASGGNSQGGQGQGGGVGGSSGGAGGSGGFYDGSEQLMVVGGENEAKQPYYVTLDPDSGDILSEGNDLRLAAVLYDPFADEWVFFNATKLTDVGADVAGQGTAEVRSWNSTDVVWNIEAQSGSGVPMPIRPNDAVMLQDFVAYVSSPMAGTISLVVADLGDLTAVNKPFVLNANEHYLGIAGYPASGSSGGQVLLFTATTIMAGDCELQVRIAAIDGSGNINGGDMPITDPFNHHFDCGPMNAHNFPFAIANPADNFSYYVVMPRGATGGAKVYHWRTIPMGSMPVEDNTLTTSLHSASGGDLDPCNDDLYLGSRDAQSLLSIAVGAPGPEGVLQRDHVPRPVLWEPYTRRVFAFGRNGLSGKHAFEAFDTDDSMAPTLLTPIDSFPIPEDLVPYAAAAKVPIIGDNALCP